MNFTPVQLAFTSLLRQRSRSILTILGMSIGIAVVITIMSAGRGLDRFIMGEMEIYSPDTISVETKIPSVKKTSTENALGQSTGVIITTIKDKDLEDIRKYPNIVAAYGWVIGQAVVKYGENNKTTLLMGEGYNLQEVEKFELSSGRMFTKDEEDSLTPVVVLGPVVKDALFGEGIAEGKTIYIKGKAFRVVGVAAERGAVFGMDMDNMVLMAAKTMQRKILGIDYYRTIIAKMKDRTLTDQTVADLEVIVRENHDITDPNKDDFAVNTMAEAAATLNTVVSGIIFLLVALVCISLAVGGVGIMNIMYVSVTERTFEIGLRKSLGAKSRDVLWQFLAEAILITVAGGVVGIIIGAILSLVIYLVAIYYNFAWVYSIPISSIILAVSFSAVVGLVFGLYPAKKAASLDPIEALRRE